VLVDRPDRSGRLAILKVHVAKVSVADGVDLDQIAGLTTGFTGADLANLVNEAAIVATRREGRDHVSVASASVYSSSRRNFVTASAPLNSIRIGICGPIAARPLTGWCGLVRTPGQFRTICAQL
jgi:SpoVK/Ycf46/Vps4 family AAA+-type ATPase